MGFDISKTPIVGSNIDSLIEVNELEQERMKLDETNIVASPALATAATTATTSSSNDESCDSDFNSFGEKGHPLNDNGSEVLNIDPTFISKGVSINNRNEWGAPEHIHEASPATLAYKKINSKEKKITAVKADRFKTDADKPKRIRNKKACDVCRKKKIKCIYELVKNERDVKDSGNESNEAFKHENSDLNINTIIPSNKQYLGIVCDHCKRNNLLCTFLAPERKRGNKKVEFSTYDRDHVNNDEHSHENNIESENVSLKSPTSNSKSSSEPSDGNLMVKKKRKRRSKSEILRDKEIEEMKKRKLYSSNEMVLKTPESVPELDETSKFKKYEKLFNAIFNNRNNKNPELNINNFNVDLFSDIYNSVNLQKQTTTNYDFDGTRNNTLNNNYFQKSIDKYNYIIDNNIPKDLNLFTLQVPLPSKDTAIRLIENAWLESFVVFRFYHRPSFIKNLHEVYSMPPHEYSEQLIKFLPALYSVMAVGSLFSEKNKKARNQSKKFKKFDNNEGNESNYSEEANLDLTGEENESVTDEEDDDEEGFKYFLAARNMIDLSNSSDLHSIQTIVMLFMFLQCSARLSTCYIFIGFAMRSALREGYHRFIPEGTPGYTLLDIEMRKRTFFTIYKMDIYVNNMLGLPKAISSNDFDQQLPLEFEDEFITDEGLNIPDNYDPEKNITSVCISNHHTKLIMILEEVVDKLYPVKKTNNVIPHRIVTDLEIKLDNWVKQLPKYLIPGLKEDQLPNEFLYKANRLLHFSFLQVQIVLYRPFIHYLIFNENKFKVNSPNDELSIKRGEMCKKIAKQTILLAKEMMERNYLNGNHWFSIYTIFFSVAGLIFYVHEATPNENNPDEMKEYFECADLCKVAKQILDSLKGSSKAASRTYNVLNTLFDSLNKRTKLFMEINFNKKQQQHGNTPSNGIFNKEDYDFNGPNSTGPNGFNKYTNVNGDTPMSDFISLFMSNNANSDGFNFSDMPNYMPPSLAGEAASYSRFNNTPIGSSYSHLVSSDYTDNKASLGVNPSNTGSQKGFTIATVSGSNLPVINENTYSGDATKQQPAVGTTPGFLNTFNTNNNKQNMLLDFNQENLFNNPAFDKHLSPMNIISDENAITSINNNTNSSSAPNSLLLKDNTEKASIDDNKTVIPTAVATSESKSNKHQQPQNNETLYLSGVFDQLDMQLFGRYLPPYMTRNPINAIAENDSKNSTPAKSSNAGK